MAHHNLGSSRVTPSRLGGFTSKSNKCHKAQVLTKRISLNPTLNFSQINQTSLRDIGEMSQRINDAYFYWWNQQPPKEGGGKAFILSPKNSHWKLASRNQNIQFWNRNIQNLKYSHYRANRTLRFENRNILFFQGLVRGGVYEVIVFHSSHLDFRLCEH
jgi:hypothetical protein